MALHWIDRMAVEVDGDGDAVVMVHGLGGTTNTWTSLAPALGGARGDGPCAGLGLTHDGAT